MQQTKIQTSWELEDCQDCLWQWLDTHQQNAPVLVWILRPPGPRSNCVHHCSWRHNQPRPSVVLEPLAPWDADQAPRMDSAERASSNSNDCLMVVGSGIPGFPLSFWNPNHHVLVEPLVAPSPPRTSAKSTAAVALDFFHLAQRKLAVIQRNLTKTVPLFPSQQYHGLKRERRQDFTTWNLGKNWTFWGSDGDVPPELGHLPGVDHRIRYTGAQGQASV